MEIPETNPQLTRNFGAKNLEQFYNSYAGSDIVAQIVIPGEAPMLLGELQTIAYSIHRENVPVRHLGHVNVRGFVKGPRTIAGSLIFTSFNEYAFYRLEQLKKMEANQMLFPLADMLPPFDVSITFSNELGSFSKMRILGVTIIDEGGTMSIDDLITEQTYSYMASGIVPIHSYNPKKAQNFAPEIDDGLLNYSNVEYILGQKINGIADVYDQIRTGSRIVRPGADDAGESFVDRLW